MVFLYDALTIKIDFHIFEINVRIFVGLQSVKRKSGKKGVINTQRRQTKSLRYFGLHSLHKH